MGRAKVWLIMNIIQHVYTFQDRQKRIHAPVHSLAHDYEQNDIYDYG